MFGLKSPFRSSVQPPSVDMTPSIFLNRVSCGKDLHGNDLPPNFKLEIKCGGEINLTKFNDLLSYINNRRETENLSYDRLSYSANEFKSIIRTPEKIAEHKECKSNQKYPNWKQLEAFLMDAAKAWGSKQQPPCLFNGLAIRPENDLNTLDELKKLGITPALGAKNPDVQISNQQLFQQLLTPSTF